MPEIAIRLAVPDDSETLAALCYEWERQYESAVAVGLEILRPRLEAALFGPRPLAEALLAELDGRTEGMALFQPLFPANNLTTGLLLKELFVRPEGRGRGIGRALMRGLARLSVARGYSRLDWTTERDNLRARAFYESLGAVRADKSYYRLQGAGLAALAGDAER